jgi:hypothetical protein
MIFIEDSGMEDPAGGIEVVTRPPLGKCSINIRIGSPEKEANPKLGKTVTRPPPQLAKLRS